MDGVKSYVKSSDEVSTTTKGTFQIGVIFDESPENADEFTVTYSSNGFLFENETRRDGTTKYYLNRANSAGGVRYTTTTSSPGSHYYFNFYYAYQTPTFNVTNYTNQTATDGTITLSNSGTPETDSTKITVCQTDYTNAFGSDITKFLYYVTEKYVKNTYDPGSSDPPYVITSPKTDVTKSGDTALQWLTGDGVSGPEYYDSAASSILRDTTAKRYQSTGLTPAEISTLEELLVTNMTTIKNASTADPSDYNGEDFPVLVVNDIMTANELVNSYLKALTNTNYDFEQGYISSGTDKAIYNVDISKWRYNSTSGKFVLQEGEAALKCTDDGFRISTSDIDNDEWQISLIDVQFYDPSDTSANKKIAYHLYVPVVVKKMLHYAPHDQRRACQILRQPYLLQ